MWDLIASSVGGAVSALLEPVNEWQKRKTIKATNQFELEKLEHQALIEVAKKRLELSKTEQAQNFNLDMLSQKSMDSSWKDEFILILFSIPLVMSFIPSLQQYALKGFEVIDTMPVWYRVAYMGMIVVIYGLRGILTTYFKR